MEELWEWFEKRSANQQAGIELLFYAGFYSLCAFVTLPTVVVGSVFGTAFLMLAFFTYMDD